jgi:mannosyltransferase OCH1-like enzyme
MLLKKIQEQQEQKQQSLDTIKFKLFSMPYALSKNYYTPVVPLKIYQTWRTKDLPPKMAENVELIKRQCPSFEHILFDDNDCREFIKNNFEQDVLNAYDSLIPGAYKADLWRLCILYIKGGIYMDIKLSLVNNGFKLIELTENEHFVLDRKGYTKYEFPIYNAFIVAKQNNPLLLLGIRKIVQNVKNKYYGDCPLDPTGPGMLGEIIHQTNIIPNIDMFNYNCVGDCKYIIYKNRFVISNSYEGYNEEGRHNPTIKYYTDCWCNRTVYKSL